MQPITSGLPAGGAQLPPAPQQSASVLAALVVTGPVSVWRPHVSRPLAGWGNLPVPAVQAASSVSRSPTRSGSGVASRPVRYALGGRRPALSAGRVPRAPVEWALGGVLPPRSWWCAEWRGETAGHAPGRADAGQVGVDHSLVRVLRAEMGRLPVDRVPRRRRGRDRQPQRTADDPLLPRTGRRVPCGTAAAVRGRRGDRDRNRCGVGLPGAAATHPPGRVPGDAAVDPDAGVVHRLRPARPRRRGPDRPALRAAAGRAGAGPAPRPPAGAPHPYHHRAEPGGALV